MCIARKGLCRVSQPKVPFASVLRPLPWAIVHLVACEFPSVQRGVMLGTYVCRWYPPASYLQQNKTAKSSLDNAMLWKTIIFVSF